MKECTEIIRDLREDKDLKQSEVAELIGTTQQQYSKYENGNTEIPARVIVKLADFYGVSTDYLLNIQPKVNQNQVFLSPKEKTLLTRWNKITKEQQRILLELLETF